MVVSLIGRKLGKYEIVQLIGRGGMATVYKGYHREIDRYAAIKVLPPHPGRDPKYVQRFRQEARTIARLHHPNILTLYDYGSEDDILYLATALIEGGSLNDLIRPEGLSLSRTEQILNEIAPALDYAHLRGVIHRDIKPGNILLDGEGRALLADFGIAKLREADVALTDTGAVVGTPIYMAPEQSRGEPADFRADIYSLGIVIYELLAGQPPYQGVSAVDVILQHITRPTPNILHLRPDLPPAMEYVMQLVLAKKSADRYQTTQDFSEAFSRAIHGSMFHVQAPSFSETTQTDVPAKPNTSNTQPIGQATLALSSDLPAFDSQTGAHTYTFLFADIEDSTQLWERQPEAMSLALAHFDMVTSEMVTAHEGEIHKGGGESIYAVFSSAEAALEAALAIQRLLYQSATRMDMPLLALSVPMGLYSGTAEKRANEFIGVALNRATRLMKAAHGGQILLSSATKDLLPPATELRDLGMHRFRDVNEPEHIFQAVSASFPLVAAPIYSLTPRPTNLPAQLSSLIGREQNVEEICRLLRQPTLRLLSLLGTGGIGKTRLSIEVGANLLDEYEDGVFFIPLAPLNQREAILKYLAQMLDIQENSAGQLEAIQAYLQPRQILLIFDNFEHILDATPLVNELLTAAARVKVLVTSRESLFIYGERTYTVSPLSLPELDQDLEHLRRAPAAALFVERVQAMMPEFTLTDDNAPSVMQICRHLDGLPLALELAAARVRDLTLAEIAEQLAQRLALLSKGPRDVPMRQQTMRGAIDWSYQLLSAEEQQSFARLAVFESQFFARAAVTITDTSDLISLRNKSLIQQPAEQIFSMLTVLREYALERLNELGESAALRQKHALYYCAWLEEAQPHLNGRDQIEWYGHMNVELYNLQAALEWFLQQQAVEDAGRMVAVLWRYWATQSRLSEGGAWIDRVLVHADQLSPLVHARTAQGAGRLALLHYDYERARTFQQISLDLFRSIDDRGGQAAVLQSFGETEFVQGNYAQAETYLEAGLSLFRELNDEAGVGRCLNLMGKLALQVGDFAKAEPLLYESLMLALAHGSSEAVGLALYALGGVLRAQGKYQEAETYYRQSLALYQELNLGVGIGTMLYNLGFALQGQGNYAAALAYFLDALKVLQPLDEMIAIAECFIGLAGAFLQTENPEMAARVLSACHAILTARSAEGELSTYDQAEYDRIYATVQNSEIDWEATWDLGQSTSTEQMIKDILKAV